MSKKEVSVRYLVEMANRSASQDDAYECAAEYVHCADDQRLLLVTSIIQTPTQQLQLLTTL